MVTARHGAKEQSGAERCDKDRRHQDSQHCPGREAGPDEAGSKIKCPSHRQLKAGQAVRSFHGTAKITRPCDIRHDPAGTRMRRGLQPRRRAGSRQAGVHISEIALHGRAGMCTSAAFPFAPTWTTTRIPVFTSAGSAGRLVSVPW